MEICLAILFTALFPLVAHTSWGLSDCVVDGNFRIKSNGLRLREVYPGCGYEEGKCMKPFVGLVFIFSYARFYIP